MIQSIDNGIDLAITPASAGLEAAAVSPTRRSPAEAGIRMMQERQCNVRLDNAALRNHVTDGRA
jgi:hypothetical protein